MSSLCIIDKLIKWTFDVLPPLQSIWLEHGNLWMVLYVTYFIKCFIWKVIHVLVQSERSHLTKVNCHFVYFIDICHFVKMMSYII